MAVRTGVAAMVLALSCPAALGLHRRSPQAVTEFIEGPHNEKGAMHVTNSSPAGVLNTESEAQVAGADSSADVEANLTVGTDVSANMTQEALGLGMAEMMNPAEEDARIYDSTEAYMDEMKEWSRDSKNIAQGAVAAVEKDAEKKQNRKEMNDAVEEQIENLDNAVSKASSISEQTSEDIKALEKSDLEGQMVGQSGNSSAPTDAEAVDEVVNRLQDEAAKAHHQVEEQLVSMLAAVRRHELAK